MENEMQLQVEAFPKKVWSVIRVFFFMLRNGISKKMLSLQLNLMLKHNKIAGKSLGNIIFHHHSAAKATANLFSFYKAVETRQSKYEVNCNNKPAHHKFLKKKPNKAHYEAQYETIEEEFMEMMDQNDVVQASSPLLSGLNWSKPLRVTDSPFPVFSGPVKDGSFHVDEAADEFIKKFYNQLRRQELIDA